MSLSEKAKKLAKGMSIQNIAESLVISSGQVEKLKEENRNKEIELKNCKELYVKLKEDNDIFPKKIWSPVDNYNMLVDWKKEFEERTLKGLVDSVGSKEVVSGNVPMSNETEKLRKENKHLELTISSKNSELIDIRKRLFDEVKKSQCLVDNIRIMEERDGTSENKLETVLANIDKSILNIHKEITIGKSRTELIRENERLNKRIEELEKAINKLVYV